MGVDDLPIETTVSLEDGPRAEGPSDWAVTSPAWLSRR